MQVIVQGQQIDVGDALRGYVEEKLVETCTKYFNHTIQSNVSLAPEANGFRTDITLSVGNGIVMKASAVNHDPYPAFDQAHNRLINQLKKYKDRLRSHHQRLATRDVAALAPANEYTLQHDESESEQYGEGGDNPVILAEMPTTLEVLSVSDAVMRMDIADQDVLVFKNAGNDRLNVVYRRRDGNIGWIDPQQS